MTNQCIQWIPIFFLNKDSIYGLRKSIMQCLICFIQYDRQTKEVVKTSLEESTIKSVI